MLQNILLYVTQTTYQFEDNMFSRGVCLKNGYILTNSKQNKPTILPVFILFLLKQSVLK